MSLERNKKIKSDIYQPPIEFPQPQKDPVISIEKAIDYDQKRTRNGHLNVNKLDKIPSRRRTKTQVIKTSQKFRAIQRMYDINQKFEEADNIDRSLF